MKRDSRFQTLGDAMDHYRAIAPDVRPPPKANCGTIEEMVSWYANFSDEELGRMQTAAAAARPPTPRKAEPLSRPVAPVHRRFETIEQELAYFQSLAPVDLVAPPTGTPFATQADRLDWYKSIGESELVRLRDQAVAQLQTEIAQIETEISSTNRETSSHELATRSAEAEAAGIQALPSIIEFNRLTSEVAKCDERIEAVSEQERLLAGFAGNHGLRL